MDYEQGTLHHEQGDFDGFLEEAGDLGSQLIAFSRKVRREEIGFKNQ